MAVSPIEIDGATLRTDPRTVGRKQQDSKPVDRSESAVSASDPASVAAAVAANRAIVIEDRSIEFSYDEEIDRVIVKVRSNDTDQIVREIPPEDYVQFLSRFKEAIGVLFDEVV